MFRFEARYRPLFLFVRLERAPDETNLQTSSDFTEKVLLTLSRTWSALPANQHDEIQQLLADVTCIPTRLQMQKPNDAYFANVSLFSDLPIVELPTAQVKGNLEKVLAALVPQSEAP